MTQPTEMIAVVEEYIFKRKGVQVKITPRPHEMHLLQLAYQFAMQWNAQNQDNGTTNN